MYILFFQNVIYEMSGGTKSVITHDHTYCLANFKRETKKARFGITSRLEVEVEELPYLQNILHKDPSVESTGRKLFSFYR